MSRSTALSCLSMLLTVSFLQCSRTGEVAPLPDAQWEIPSSTEPADDNLDERAAPPDMASPEQQSDRRVGDVDGPDGDSVSGPDGVNTDARDLWGTGNTGDVHETNEGLLDSEILPETVPADIAEGVEQADPVAEIVTTDALVELDQAEVQEVTVDCSALICDDGDPCTGDFCDPAIGCVFLPNPNVACDDGDPCTEFDKCQLDQTCKGAPKNCGSGYVCQNGECVCVPSCQGKECGTDGCGGSCGVCVEPGKGCKDGKCMCIPDCNCRACGPDGCGGTCGDGCLANESCIEGRCICQPDCFDKECGYDGCGGNCATCFAGDYCFQGKCLPRCGNGICDSQFGETSCLCPQDCGLCAGCCRNAECVADTGLDNCGEEGTVCARCAPGEACIQGLCQWVCGDGECQEGEDCATCVDDCGHCCGDGVCEESRQEDCFTCQLDCGSCCGNGKCTWGHLESCSTCPDDCGMCKTECGDGNCQLPYESCHSCLIDCGACCGDGKCDDSAPPEEPLPEDIVTCPADCNKAGWAWEPPSECGNGIIEYFELCDDGNAEDGDGCSSACLDETVQFPEPGSVVFTEIMVNPTAVMDITGQWFEVRNCTSSQIDLQGTVVSNQVGDSHLVQYPVVVQPGDWAVFGRNVSEELNGGFQPDYVYSGVKFNLNEDTLTLTSPGGGLLDSLHYDSAIFPMVAGHSMNLHQLVHSDSANDEPEVWCAAQWLMTGFDSGSPGYHNMLCPGAPTCGDGLLQVNEECEDGNDTAGDGCSDLCRWDYDPICGDGFVGACEECDDANPEDGDGCSADCLWEVTGWCGNGILQLGEQCDDGNLLQGDGCGPECRFESVCGNGIREAPEICDDGNNLDGDGCGGGCQRIKGEAKCGDGVVTGNEQCDDGCLVGTAGVCEPAFDNGDGCDIHCHWEGDPVAWPHRCGNGIVEPQDGEECDPPYHSVGWNMCTGNCMLEPCTGVCCPSPCCGNGVVEMLKFMGRQNWPPPADYEEGFEPAEWPEECDDGNLLDGDGCSHWCTAESYAVITGNASIEPEVDLNDVRLVALYSAPPWGACGTTTPGTEDSPSQAALEEADSELHYTYISSCSKVECEVHFALLHVPTGCLLASCPVSFGWLQNVSGPDFDVKIPAVGETKISGTMYFDGDFEAQDRLYLFVTLEDHLWHDPYVYFELPLDGQQYAIPYEVSVHVSQDVGVSAVLDRGGDLNLLAGPQPGSEDMYGINPANLKYVPKCTCPSEFVEVDILINKPVEPQE